MYSIAKLALLGLISVKAWTNPTQPGAGVSITKKGANNAKDVFAPYIFAYLKDLEIAEVDFDGGSLTDLVIKLPQPSLDKIVVNTDYSTQGVELIANGVSATISSNFTYKYWITVSGELAIKINNLGIDMEVDLGIQQVGNEKAPHLTLEKDTINVNPDDVEITLTGGLVSRIASIFIPFLKSTVIPDLITTIRSTIKDIVNTDINKDIYEYGTHI